MKSESWLSVEMQSKILPHLNCRCFYTSVGFVSMSSQECLFDIFSLNVTGFEIFQLVFLRVDQGIATCFDRREM